MITVQLKGGLGNQLFQFAFGQVLAEKNGQKVCYDRSYFRDYKLFNFELDNIISSEYLAEPKNIGMMAKFYCENDRWMKFLPSMPGLFIEPRNGKPVNLKGVPSNSYVSGYWQNKDYFLNSREQIRSKFKMPEQADFGHEQYLDDCSKGEILGVHIRRGDFFSNPSTAKVHAVCTLDYYLAAEKAILSLTPIRRIYVFSDDPDWVKSSIQFQSLTTVLPRSNLPHQDLLAFSKAPLKILSNSSFSWWAAFMGDQGDNRIVAPERWGNVGYLSKVELVNDSWIKIKSQ